MSICNYLKVLVRSIKVRGWSVIGFLTDLKFADVLPYESSLVNQISILLIWWILQHRVQLDLN